jgi:hypothetical protein
MAAVRQGGGDGELLEAILNFARSSERPLMKVFDSKGKWRAVQGGEEFPEVGTIHLSE